MTYCIYHDITCFYFLLHLFRSEKGIQIRLLDIFSYLKQYIEILFYGPYKFKTNCICYYYFMFPYLLIIAFKLCERKFDPNVVHVRQFKISF